MPGVFESYFPRPDEDSEHLLDLVESYRPRLERIDHLDATLLEAWVP